jgi:hypothetical protein
MLGVLAAIEQAQRGQRRSDPSGCAMTKAPRNPLVLDRMVAALENVKQRLVRVVSALADARVPYAIVGGHAVAAWVASIDAGAVRNTQDVDVLIQRADFTRCKFALERSGFVYRHIAGLDVFLGGPGGSPRSGVHLVFAGEFVRPNEPLPNPSVDAAENMTAHLSDSGDGRTATMRVLRLESLVTLKLTAFRDKHRAHLRDLIGVGLVDASWIPHLPVPVAPRLQSLLDDPLG